MAIYQLFSHCVTCNYRNYIYSKAFFIVIICLFLAYIPPFAILFGSNGFWLKTRVSREKPDVHFKHEFLVVMETSEFDIPSICSTLSTYQFPMTDKNICSATKVFEEDIDRDGKNDNLILEIEVPLQNADTVYHIMIFLLFDYRLSFTSEFYMESMGFIEKSSSWVGAARLDVYGDLRLLLKEPIIPYGVDDRYNKSIFHSVDDVIDIRSILNKYSQRNVSTHIFPANTLWTFGRVPTDPFILNAKIHYPEEDVMYYTSILEGLKWAWIQYLALLWPFLYLSHRFCSWVFRRRIVNAIVTVDAPVTHDIRKKFL